MFSVSALVRVGVASALTVVLVGCQRSPHTSVGPATTPPAAPTTRPTSLSPPSSSPSGAPDPPPATAVGAVVGPWRATVLSTLTAAALVTVDGGLYGIEPADHEAFSLVQINPADGAAVRRVKVLADVAQLVVADGAVWITEGFTATGDVTLASFTPTLTRRTSTTLNISDTAQYGVTLAADPVGQRVYLAGGKRVAVIDARSGGVIRYLPLASAARALAVSPDGSRLYVAEGDGVTLVTLDTATGAILNSASTDANVETGGLGITATAGGLFLNTAGGMSEQLDFVPFIHLATPVEEATAGGGNTATVTISQGTAWIGGPHLLACADPDTGIARAQVPVPPLNATGEEETISDITTIGTRTVALYQDPGQQALVMLTPPATCSHT